MADIFLINKVDLVEEDDLNSTIELIKSMNPQASIYTTSFGQIKGDFSINDINKLVVISGAGMPNKSGIKMGLSKHKDFVRI